IPATGEPTWRSESKSDSRTRLLTCFVNRRISVSFLRRTSYRHENIGRQFNDFSAGFESLEQRRLLAAPVLDAIAAQSVPANKTIQIPLTASDSDGDTLSYSVSSNSASVIPTLRSTSNTYLKFHVTGPNGINGDMIFQLFNDLAPEAVRNITGLVNAGYYNGLTFHRVIKNFVLQGGDKAGTGSGPSPFQFNDEFNQNAIFSGTGQLAMANAGKDT